MEKLLNLKVKLVKFKNLDSVFEEYCKDYDIKCSVNFIDELDNGDMGNNISYDELNLILGNKLNWDNIFKEYWKYNVLMNKIIFDKLIKYGVKKYKVKWIK